MNLWQVIQILSSFIAFPLIVQKVSCTISPNSDLSCEMKKVFLFVREIHSQVTVRYGTVIRQTLINVAQHNFFIGVMEPISVYRVETEHWIFATDQAQRCVCPRSKPNPCVTIKQKSHCNGARLSTRLDLSQNTFGESYSSPVKNGPKEFPIHF